MITFSGTTKRYGTQTVLDAVDIQINPGERVGVVGPNGAGKSTLIEMIAGEVDPDAGRVSVPAALKVGYLRQQLGSADVMRDLLSYAEDAVPRLRVVEDELHRLEAIFASREAHDREEALTRHGELQSEYEALGGYVLRHAAEAALSGLGFSADAMSRPVSTFSGGWQMRAELARALVSEPDVLLLDEPSNYLDLPAVEWLQRRLREYKGTLLLVSHDRYLLNSLTTVTLEVANGFAERYLGNYDAYVAERASRYEQRIAAHRNQQRKRDEAETFIRRFRAKATKAAQVRSRVKMLEKLEKINVPQQVRSRGTIRISEPPHCGAEIARLEGIGHSYNGSEWVLRGLDLRIEKGSKIALVGLNGMGKTTLMRILAGTLAPTEGRRVLGHKVMTGYQSQEFTDTIDFNQTVFEVARASSDGSSDQQVRSMLGGFGFSGDAVEKKAGVLSGGEKVRLAFARLLISPPNFLLLDEPTTHLDIAAREALEEALRSYKGTLCVVSHDVAFVRNVAEEIVAMAPPGVQRYSGNYEYYRQKLAEQASAATSSAARPSGTPVTATDDDAQSARERRRQRADERHKRQGEIKQHRRTVKQCERQIEVFEVEREKLLAQLSDPEQATDYASLNQRFGLIQGEIESYTARWEAAAEVLAEFGDEG